MSNVYLPEEFDLRIRARLIAFALSEARDLGEIRKGVRRLNRRLVSTNLGVGLLAKSLTSQEAEKLQQLWATHGVQLHIKNTRRIPGVGFDFEKRTRNLGALLRIALYVGIIAVYASYIVKMGNAMLATYALLPVFVLFFFVWQRPILFPKNVQKLFDFSNEANPIDVRCFSVRKSIFFRLLSAAYIPLGFLFVYLMGDSVMMIILMILVSALGVLMFSQIDEGRFMTLVYYEQKVIVIDSISWIYEHDVALSPTGVQIGKSKVELPKDLRKMLIIPPDEESAKDVL